MGDGPDILLTSNRVLLLADPILKDKWTHGISDNAQIDLTRTEAESLICSLQMAIQQLDDIDNLIDVYGPKDD